MDFLNHDLAHEFPQYREKMHSLKASDAQFARLFSRYDDDNHTIAKYEKGVGSISDEALETLKKRRLKTKDEIYEILKTR
ncbi:YdcH family protein [Polaromonas jejuensis]|uniref:YdcH family protein n=1 Tax=Polaromonas jejuensis TaxID=457502 RepID=A0ABW0Q588_9BURK|nr:YdcH family protein [Polaromonas jejuensis]